MKTNLLIALIIFMSFSTLSDKVDRYKFSGTNERAIASIPTKNSIGFKKKNIKQNVSTANKRVLETRNKYLEASKYPSTSSPVDDTKTADHLLMRFSDKPKFLKVDKTIVKLWSEKLYYNRAKDQVRIFYSLKQDESAKTKLILSGLNKSKTLIPTKIDDYNYVATFSAKDVLEGDYRITMEVNNKASVSTSFAIRDHHLDFLKVEKDTITSLGNLNFTSQVDIHIAGDYIVEGTLYAEGKLIATAEIVTTLNKGLQSFDLSFYGKILHDKKISGLLELKNISISFVKPSLASKNLGLISVNYKSANYTFDQFHNISFDNKLLLDKSRVGLKN